MNLKAMMLRLDWKAVMAALLSGLLLVLVFPRISWAWLAPAFLVPLLLVLPGRPLKHSFFLGWLSGAVFWGGACYWIYPVMRDYASIPPVVAGLLFVGFFSVKALYAGSFAMIAGRLLQRSWAVPAISVLWVAIEGCHQYLDFSFTWLQTGNAALEFPLQHILQLAPWTGIYGPSLVFALINVAIAVALLRHSYRPLLFLMPILGLFLLPALPPQDSGSEVARLIQPNVHPDQVRSSWLAEQGTAHLSKMLELSKQPRDGVKPSLVIWPEYPMSFFYFDDAPMRSFLERVAKESNASFIFNTISYEDSDRMRPRNSSVTLDQSGKRLSHYSKLHLVPFGEYVPWPFNYFVQKITMAAGTFEPGSSISTARVNGHEIGTYICYESVFARTVRKFTASGAELLVNISNDSWYGQSAAREQHLLIARLRAIENGRWILRSTNDGITAAIDPAGRITASLPSFQQDILDVQFNYLNNRTGFVQFGEWFWWLCLFASVTLTWIEFVPRRQSGN